MKETCSFARRGPSGKSGDVKEMIGVPQRRIWADGYFVYWYEWTYYKFRWDISGKYEARRPGDCSHWSVNCKVNCKTKKERKIEAWCLYVGSKIGEF